MPPPPLNCHVYSDNLLTIHFLFLQAFPQHDDVRALPGGLVRSLVVVSPRQQVEDLFIELLAGEIVRKRLHVQCQHVSRHHLNNGRKIDARNCVTRESRSFSNCFALNLRRSIKIFIKMDS